MLSRQKRVADRECGEYASGYKSNRLEKGEVMLPSSGRIREVKPSLQRLCLGHHVFEKEHAPIPASFIGI